MYPLDRNEYPLEKVIPTLRGPAGFDGAVALIVLSSTRETVSAQELPNITFGVPAGNTPVVLNSTVLAPVVGPRSGEIELITGVTAGVWYVYTFSLVTIPPPVIGVTSTST